MTDDHTASSTPRRPDRPASTRLDAPTPGRLRPPSRTDGRPHIDPDRLARALARWYVEALAGRRDPRALRDLLTPAVSQRVRWAVLREAVRRHAGRSTQSAVVSVRACRVRSTNDRHEATVVVDDGERATAVVATLHRTRESWVVSELARPEDGLPPLPPPWLVDDPVHGRRVVSHRGSA